MSILRATVAVLWSREFPAKISNVSKNSKTFPCVFGSVFLPMFGEFAFLGFPLFIREFKRKMWEYGIPKAASYHVFLANNHDCIFSQHSTMREGERESHREGVITILTPQHTTPVVRLFNNEPNTRTPLNATATDGLEALSPEKVTYLSSHTYSLMVKKESRFAFRTTFPVAPGTTTFIIYLSFLTGY